MYRQKISPYMGRPVANKYKVPLVQWRKWSNQARSIFNKMYDCMRPSMQGIFSHPHALPLPKEQWATLRWNAAWQAAFIVNGAPGRLTGVVMRGKNYTPTEITNGQKQIRRQRAGTGAAAARKRVPR